MSSMRNAVQRRNHKERSQLHGREKLGILEKHKDYALRAKDYNEKKRRLRVLRQKATERNPDEFHFAMMRSSTDNAGRKIADRGNQALSQETVRLLKTQDAGYLRTIATKTRKDIENLKQTMAFKDEGNDDEGAAKVTSAQCNGRSNSVKTIFADEMGEQDMHTQTRRQSSKFDQEGGNDVDDGTQEQMQRWRSRSRAWREARLMALLQRQRELMATERALELERARMASNVGGLNKNGVKYRIRRRKG